RRRGLSRPAARAAARPPALHPRGPRGWRGTGRRAALPPAAAGRDLGSVDVGRAPRAAAVSDRLDQRRVPSRRTPAGEACHDPDSPGQLRQPPAKRRTAAVDQPAVLHLALHVLQIPPGHLLVERLVHGSTSLTTIASMSVIITFV